ncbi:MAG: GrpB family protein [Acidimicrobiia bacterium]|nr:GrpB family protein [Acidimicrobiia bacterium]
MDATASSSDDEIAKAWVGEPVRLDGPITLHEPDPVWLELYRREETRIRDVLGDRTLLVEHVGSTSVPGLVAKPIIDIVLAVADSSDEASYLPDLEDAGYTLVIREEDWFEHRVFKGPDTDINLHVFSVGTVEIDRMIAFRNHLRADAGDRMRYEDVKRSLASQKWAYVQNYADAKTQVITEIMRRAMQ